MDLGVGGWWGGWWKGGGEGGSILENFAKLVLLDRIVFRASTKIPPFPFPPHSLLTPSTPLQKGFQGTVTIGVQSLFQSLKVFLSTEEKLCQPIAIRDHSLTLFLMVG